MHSLAEIAQLPSFVDAGVDLKRDLYPLARRLVWKVSLRVGHRGLLPQD
jgi:hypothetical protein